MRFGAALLIVLLATPAQAGVRLEFNLGNALNARTPVSVRQGGEKEIRFDGDWRSDGFKLPPYYTIRLGWGSLERGWEFQFTHHKLELNNTTPEVEHLELTHGFNIGTLNRVLPVGPCVLRAGAGLVLAHPQSNIRGEPYDADDNGGYALTGPVFLVGVGKAWPVGDALYVNLDGAASFAWADVPVSRGEAEVTNLAFHAMAGIGWRF